MEYKFKEIEKKWQKNWQFEPYFSKQKKDSPKFYCLDMFPYPSASGLHVGHWKGYVFSDLFARKKYLEGFNILHPMGWDAFGLPAENDAIKKGLHPEQNTNSNIANFKKQLQTIGAVYDWSKEISTTDPNYYKWTQWIFIKMFEKGLAYEEHLPVNWCPKCLTGLANEEVRASGCDRCGTLVEQKLIRQWVLKITKYADELHDDLDELNWPEKVKLMQKNWIGRSDGLMFKAPVKDTNLFIETFSAHFEAFKADTFVVIAPDHPFLPRLVDGLDNAKEILEKAEELTNKRKSVGHDEKFIEGFFTGRYIVDPVGNGNLPIWVASFAIKDYGTGIVKCSAHDQRDFAFAKKYGIKLKTVLMPKNNPELKEKVLSQEICFDDMENGILTEPEEFAGKIAGQCREEIIKYCEKNNLATRKRSYKLRDWIFSRQRYWGEPIPLIHCKTCGIVPVPESELPLKLPQVENYQPSGTGESPLATIPEWVNTTCPKCKGGARRETNTMPQWAGSCWYFLRYINPNFEESIIDPVATKYWMPVDLYVGGIEHAVLHLLYARFYVKFLHEIGVLDFKEPFKKLFNQGMVCMKSPISGRVEKMSKSKGNVVNPDDILQELGSDCLRMYMLFMGPPEQDTEWSSESIKGVSNFLQRLWNFLIDENNFEEKANLSSQKRWNLFLKEFTERIESYKVNTAVSAIMEYLNDLQRSKLKLDKLILKDFLVALSVMVPHFSSELLELKLQISLENLKWPIFDPNLATTNSVEIAVQINGKLRATINLENNADEEIVKQAATEKINHWLDKPLIKIIFVKNKIINFVIKN